MENEEAKEIERKDITITLTPKEQDVILLGVHEFSKTLNPADISNSKSVLSIKEAIVKAIEN